MELPSSPQENPNKGPALLGANHEPLSSSLSRKRPRSTPTQMPLGAEEQQLMFRTMADCAPVMIWVSGIDGKCFFFNEPWFAFTGKTIEEEYGDGWADGVHADDLKRCLDTYVSHFTARKPFQMAYRLRRYDGEYRWVLDNGVPRYNSTTKEFEGYIGSCIDVTEQKRLEQDLIAAKEAVERAAQAKIDFLALMSHEIRTPLATIIGMSDLIEESKTSQERAECLSTITQAAKQLHVLLSDSLDVAKLEKDGIVLWDSSCNLCITTREVIGLLQSSAQQKGVSLTYQCSLQDLDGECTADEVRWKQLVMYLVSNAIKSTPSEGSVHVILTKAGWSFTLQVSDTGSGEPELYREELFSPFTQAHANYARSYGGNGLGLFICHKIATAAKGSIIVSKNNPQGTIFTAALNVKPPTGARMSLSPSQQSSQQTTPPIAPTLALPSDRRVLIVEDNAVNRRVISKILSTLGIAPDIAENGQAAVELSARNAYDLIFMDCQMPILDGFSTTRIIRCLPNHTKTPIIALTAYAIPGAKERCLAVGMNDCLTKPFSKTQVVNILQRYLLTDSAVS